MNVVVRSGEEFAFSKDNRAWAEAEISKYPEGFQESAVMPLLTRAQEQLGGSLNIEAIEYVAEFLNMPKIRVLEVATFYSMYNLRPVGTHVVEVCTTTPCWLRGSDEIVRACEDELGILLGETTEDGQFTLKEVECLGACVNAPICSIHRKYYEDLDADSMRKILKALKSGQTPTAGPQIDRQTSAPVGGQTTLVEAAE